MKLLQLRGPHRYERGSQQERLSNQDGPGSAAQVRSCDHPFRSSDNNNNERAQSEEKAFCGDVTSSAFAPECFIRVFFLFSFSGRNVGFFKVSF